MTIYFKKSHLPSLEWILSVVIIDECGWLNRPWAQRSQSVGGGSEADINHVSSMQLTLGAIERLWGRLLQEHPLQRALVDGGLYIQVNNSLCPQGSSNKSTSITESRGRKRVGNKEGKETTNIYLLSLLSLFCPFLSWFTIGSEKLEVNWLGQVNLKKQALVLVCKQLLGRNSCNIQNNKRSHYMTKCEKSLKRLRAARYNKQKTMNTNIPSTESKDCVTNTNSAWV